MAQGQDGGPDGAPLTATVAEQLREKAETERAADAEREASERVRERMEAHKADEQAAVERHLVAPQRDARPDRGGKGPALPASAEAIRSAFSRAPALIFAVVAGAAVLGRGWVRLVALAAAGAYVARAVSARARAASEAAGA